MNPDLGLIEAFSVLGWITGGALSLAIFGWASVVREPALRLWCSFV